jgi:hypothetical protein
MPQSNTSDGYKNIYNINANDHLINPNNSGKTICILPIKVREIFDLNIYLNLNISLTCL